jgi:cobalt/nickel transport system ATP-binding protein
MSLTVKNLSLWRDKIKLCDDINLCVAEKEKIAVIGHNGSGKTTLLETFVGLCPKISGEITLFDEREIDLKKVGYLLQDSDDHFLVPIVEDDVAFSLLARGSDRENAAKKTAAVLEALGIAHLAKKIVYHLSGGEKKLVALAGVLITDPKLLLLDEPTAGLDYAAQIRLADILKNLDVSMVIVSHDWEFLESIASRFYMLTPQCVKEIQGFKGFVTHVHDGLPPHAHTHTH